MRAVWAASYSNTLPATTSKPYGQVKSRRYTWGPVNISGGVLQLGELELPPRARVTYRPVAEGWR